MHSAHDLAMCLADFNGHIGRHIDGWYGVDQRNLEVRMLIEFCPKTELYVSNTRLKGEKKRNVMFRLGENETEVNLTSHIIKTVGVLFLSTQS